MKGGDAVTGTTYTELVTSALNFVADYSPIIVAGAVVGLMGYALRRIVKAAR